MPQNKQIIDNFTNSLVAESLSGSRNGGDNGNEAAI